MKDIHPNKEQLLQRYNFKLDIKKDKDVLGKKEVKIKDILGNKNDKVINKMSDIFPQNQTDNNNNIG